MRVLANDTDPDGEVLTTRSVQRRTTAGGTVRLHGGAVTYTSAAGFVGPDSFTYTAADPRGGTASATVRVLVHAADATPTPAPAPAPTPGSPWSPTPTTGPTTGPTTASTGQLPDTGGPAARLAWGGLASTVTGALLVGAALRRPRRRA